MIEIDGDVVFSLAGQTLLEMWSSARGAGHAGSRKIVGGSCRLLARRAGCAGPRRDRCGGWSGRKGHLSGSGCMRPGGSGGEQLRAGGLEFCGGSASARLSRRVGVDWVGSFTIEPWAWSGRVFTAAPWSVPRPAACHFRLGGGSEGRLPGQGRALSTGLVQPVVDAVGGTWPGDGRGGPGTGWGVKAGQATPGGWRVGAWFRARGGELGEEGGACVYLRSRVAKRRRGSFEALWRDGWVRGGGTGDVAPPCQEVLR